MTEQRGIPDDFLTLSPNDDWPHIQSTIKKGMTDPSEFHDLTKKPAHILFRIEHGTAPGNVCKVEHCQSLFLYSQLLNHVCTKTKETSKM